MIVMKLNRLLAILVVLAIGMTGAHAQLPDQLPEDLPAEVSENELEHFAQAFREIQVIDQQVQMEMLSTVQEDGIDVDRFNEFLTAQQDPAQEFDASEEELSKFAAAYQEIEKIQEKALQQMEEAIQESELTMERYQEIAMTIQANPELLQKLQEHFEEE
jgi:predicted ribosome quality control (RQC) complex YloA/Tae2 family protein